MIEILRNLGIAIAGITFIILVIKMATETDNKAKYIRLIKHTIIATILITIVLTLIEIPKNYFGDKVEITDGQLADITIGKIEDKDCQGREVVNIDGRRYVVTDTNVTLTAISEGSQLVSGSLITTQYKLESCCILKSFSECQGTFKGFFANIQYYRDSTGIIFPATATYSEYQRIKGLGGQFTNTGGDGGRRRCRR